MASIASSTDGGVKDVNEYLKKFSNLKNLILLSIFNYTICMACYDRFLKKFTIIIISSYFYISIFYGKIVTVKLVPTKTWDVKYPSIIHS
jgi:hypothetical protein